jgi:ornithine decarboxylase
MDVFASALTLPADVREGDWIEIGTVGAYSIALATRFNGFGLEHFAEVGETVGDSS